MGTSHTSVLKHAASQDTSAWESNYAPVPNGGAVFEVPGTAASVIDPQAAPGTVIVSAGITSTNLAISGTGRELIVFGTVSNTHISDGASLHVHKGGVAINTTMSNASFSDVDFIDNGTADGMVLVRAVDGSIFGQGALAENIQVDSGASLAVYSAGTTSNTVLYGGATQSVGSGGVVSSTVVSSGGQNYVFTLGVSSNTMVATGGYEFVSAGGISQHATVFGFEMVSGGGMSENALVYGSESIMSGGNAMDATIEAGGMVYVSSGGTDTNDAVGKGGTAFLMAGGTEDNLAVGSGGTLVYAGGTLDANTLANGILAGATVSVIGGALSGFNVHRGVNLIVAQGAATTHTVLSAGGIEMLSGGTELSGIIDTGGTLTGYGTVTSLTDQGSLVASQGTLVVTNAIAGLGALATLAAADLELQGGGLITTNVTGTGTLELNGSNSFTMIGHLTAPVTVEVDAGTTLFDRAYIAGAVIDNGMLILPPEPGNPNGLAVLNGPISGVGTLSADVSEILAINGGGTFSGTLAGAGTIQLNSSLTLDTGASLQAGEILANHNLTLGSLTQLSNQSGHALVFDEASAGGTLIVSGPNTAGLTNYGDLHANGAGSVLFSLGFTNLGTVTLTGKALSFIGPVTNKGIIDADGGNISIATTINGAGILEIGLTGTLSLLGAVGASQTVDFLNVTGDLSLNNPLSFHGNIAGFTQGDLIDLLKVPAVTSLSYANSVLTVKDGTAVVASLQFSGLSPSASFTTANDGSGGTFIKLN